MPNILKPYKATNLTAFSAGISMGLLANIVYEYEMGQLLLIGWFFITGVIFVKGFNTLNESFVVISLRFLIWFVGASLTSALLFEVQST